ncbi:MAG: SDR family NAD(P)-dependent oxidoreductase [Nitrospirae bacterium]|nr:SDR family NAD(P)-dependent oxidoreductase [Nitrospirota bacterium]
MVTGASSGIGRAIALALASLGVRLCLVGRKLKTLEAVASGIKKIGSDAYIYKVNLEKDEDLRQLKKQIEKDFGGTDILIHSAGDFAMGRMTEASIKDLDRLYRVNVRAPYLLTQLLLPGLKRRRGQVVFINSSVGLRARAQVGQYSATKHALKAVADCLRDETNEDGIRVVSVYPGRTATPMQKTVLRMEGKAYNPKQFMQPEDVASVVISALMLPFSAEVTDINIRPLAKQG